jgi:hypothetical protein
LIAEAGSDFEGRALLRGHAGDFTVMFLPSPP